MSTEQEPKEMITDEEPVFPQKEKITLKQVGHDLLISFIAGLVTAVTVAAIGALLGLLLYKDPEIVPIPWLQGAVSGMLIVGSLSMFCSAFFFTKRRRKEGSGMSRFWKEKFQCFDYQVVFLVVSVVVIAAGCLLDVVLRSVS